MSKKKTVDFLTAINSGKRFREVNGHYWFSCDSKNNGHILKDTLKMYIGSDFINSQFELEEKTITISESEFDKWVKFYMTDDCHLNEREYADRKKELGF
jgi:hypothetical protein